MKFLMSYLNCNNLQHRLTELLKTKQCGVTKVKKNDKTASVQTW